MFRSVPSIKKNIGSIGKVSTDTLQYSPLLPKYKPKYKLIPKVKAMNSREMTTKVRHFFLSAPSVVSPPLIEVPGSLMSASLLSVR